MEKLTFDDCVEVLALIDAKLFELMLQKKSDCAKEYRKTLNYLHEKFELILKELYKKNN